MRRLTRTVTAESDLEEILEYLTTHSPPAASKFATDFEARCQLLPSQPNTGRPRDDLAPGLRSVVVGRYVAFFLVTDDDVVIVRVLHGARNIKPEMFDGV
jgi:toxin ParE1/3/4